jgi:hypothetical protein
VPSEDLPGEDISGIQRYPGAVRVKYESHLLGNERVSEVGDAQEFYEPRTPLAS